MRMYCTIYQHPNIQLNETYGGDRETAVQGNLVGSGTMPTTANPIKYIQI